MSDFVATSNSAAGAVAPSDLPVGIIGFGWMGRVHAQAYARVRHHYPDLPLVPRLTVIADDVAGRAASAAAQFAVPRSVVDWRSLIADPAVSAVSVTAPNFLHREIGCAVVESGKHLWIEKPVGLSAADARAVADAARAAGVATAVGFNYRNAPAVESARQRIAAGEIGEITHARFRFFSDYAAHPDGALSWRFARERGGNGVLGDLASHGVDLIWYLLGDVEELAADAATFIDSRPIPHGATSGHQLATGAEHGSVENEDYVSAQLRMTSGARCVLEASRISVGEQNSYGFEIHGTKGILRWDFRRLGELEVGGGGYQDVARATVFVGPGHGDYGAFQPGSANAMSYDDLKVIEAARWCAAIAGRGDGGATIDDAVRAAELVEAMTTSIAERRWVAPVSRT
ncbi:MAG: Gfo/Idh/MocA family oxidoreductase [Gordonia sp. (in: high G+C Gram-positive bacteria)]